MAKHKTTLTVKSALGKDFSAINKSIVEALRLLHAAGILEQSADGWTYTAPAHVTLPVNAERSAMLHWSSETTI